jgi:hypothetical protein
MVLALAAAGIPGAQPLPAGANPAAAAVPDLPLSLLARMLKLTSPGGASSELPAAIAQALGLGADGKAWPDRQYAVEATSTGAVHAIAVGRGEDPDVVISVRGPAAISIFRVTLTGKLVAAVNFFPETKLTTPMPLAQARDALWQERAFWAAHIDQLGAAG